jgi:hypothetical protein
MGFMQDGVVYDEKFDSGTTTDPLHEVSAVEMNKLKACLLELRGTAYGFANPCYFFDFATRVPGTTDDGPALVSALALAQQEGFGIIVPLKLTVKSAVGPIDVPLNFAGAGALDCQAGASLALNGPLTAQDGAQIFFGTTGLTINAPLREVDPSWWGADPSGVSDSTVALKAALASGKHVGGHRDAIYSVNDSLFMQVDGQEFRGGCTIAMSATLGKPCLWLGAISSAGAPPVNPVNGLVVRGLRFRGSGLRAANSAGIAFGSARAATLDGISCRGFNAGLEVRGVSSACLLPNVDLSGNTYGLFDRADTTGAAALTGAAFVGGRITGNAKEGVVLGSTDVRFSGTDISGNSDIATMGGTGEEPEVRLTPGQVGLGGVDFTDVHMATASANVVASMIRVDVGATKRVNLRGGSYDGGDSTARFIIQTLSTEALQSFSVVGGQFSNFRNYLQGTISGVGAQAVVMPGWADQGVDMTDDLHATGGALRVQLGFALTLPDLFIPGSFLGKPAGGQRVFIYDFPVSAILPANLADSSIALPVVLPTGSLVFTLQRLPQAGGAPITIGTINYGPDGGGFVFPTVASDTAFSFGDRLLIFSQPVADATASDFSFTLVARRATI